MPRGPRPWREQLFSGVSNALENVIFQKRHTEIVQFLSFINSPFRIDKSYRVYSSLNRPQKPNLSAIKGGECIHLHPPGLQRNYELRIVETKDLQTHLALH
jgi:hypothetical protein